MERTVKDILVQVVQGNIVQQDGITAVVNAANARLKPGGGVAGTIHRAAGPGLEKECSPLAPISPGQAVITGGHNLPNRYVIHCLGPVYGVDRPEDRYLAECYRNALRLADQKKIESIAFPSISTGAFGYPVREAAEVAFDAIREVIPELRHVRLIRFTLFSKEDLNVYERELSRITLGS